MPADVQALLTWSKPVNGLVARIEHVWAEREFFVRLKNVSDRALSVPMGNPDDKKAAPLFEVYVRQGSNPWRRTGKSDWYYGYYPPPSKSQVRALAVKPQHPLLQQLQEQHPTDRPWVTLQPGEDCVAVIAGADEKDSGEAKIVKAVLRRPDASAFGHWSGVLETPSRVMEPSLEQYRAIRGRVPFPSHFPLFSYDYSGFPQAADPSAVEGLHGPNRPLMDMVAIYDPTDAKKELEQRILAAKVLPMKLLLASIAAPAGSKEAAMLFLETMKDTDYLTACNLRYALEITYWNYGGDFRDSKRRAFPDWLVELSLAVLSDNRFVTGLENAHFQQGTSLRMSACKTDGLIFCLGESKCRKAVPLLIERAKDGDGNAMTALGNIGDPRRTRRA